MKKKIYLLVITMLLCFTAFNSYAAAGGGDNTYTPLTKEAIKKMTPDEKKVCLQNLKTRMADIESVDKTKMSKEDRKILREEMKSLRHDSNAVGGGGLAVEIGGGVVVLVLVGLLSGL